MGSNYEYLLQYFAYQHLPAQLQAVSKQFSELAYGIVDTLPQNLERTVALRKLLEAKDCAVRSAIFKSEAEITGTVAPTPAA
mgnify:CR=1 FL=1